MFALFDSNTAVDCGVSNANDTSRFKKIYVSVSVSEISNVKKSSEESRIYFGNEIISEIYGKDSYLSILWKDEKR